MDLSRITPSITVDLNSSLIESMVREAFKDHMPGFCVDKVTFSTSQDWDMRGEPCNIKFSGAKVTFKKADDVTAW